jgi:hypothetical protein
MRLQAKLFLQELAKDAILFGSVTLIGVLVNPTIAVALLCLLFLIAAFSL